MSVTTPNKASCDSPAAPYIVSEAKIDGKVLIAACASGVSEANYAEISVATPSDIVKARVLSIRKKFSLNDSPPITNRL